MQDKCSSPDGSSPRVVYQGVVLQTVKAMIDVTNGGQVLMDAATMHEISRSQERLLAEFSTKDRVKLLRAPSER